MFWDTFGSAPGHVAIYVGAGKIVHALNEERGIVTSDWNAPMGGNNRYMGARRLFDDDGAPLPLTGALPGPSAGSDDPHPAPDTTPPARPPRREHERKRGRIRQRILDGLRRRRVWR